MIDYYDGQITDLLPKSYTSEATVQALSYALRVGTRLLYDYGMKVYIYCSIDSATDEVLDYLAKELRTQYYSDEFDIETKRSLVRNTMMWYMQAGTPAAVEELVNIVFGEAEVEEWFEYGGEPYWFMITTESTLGEQNVAYFSEMVKRVKNTRSHLWAISTPRDVTVTQRVGIDGTSDYLNPPVIAGSNSENQATMTTYHAVRGFAYSHPQAIRESV